MTPICFHYQVATRGWDGGGRAQSGVLQGEREPRWKQGAGRGQEATGSVIVGQAHLLFFFLSLTTEIPAGGGGGSGGGGRILASATF